MQRLDVDAHQAAALADEVLRHGVRVVPSEMHSRGGQSVEGPFERGGELRRGDSGVVQEGEVPQGPCPRATLRQADLADAVSVQLREEVRQRLGGCAHERLFV